MRRISAIFIAICMVLIAGSIGAVLYLGFKVDESTSAIVALAALTAMALYNAVSGRLRDRGDVGDQIADLSRGTADLARQVAEMSRRLIAVESRVEGAVNKARGAVDPIAAEIGELGGLVRQIADTVASHAAALQQQGALPAPAGPSPAAVTDIDGALTLSESDAVGGRLFRSLSREGIVALVGKAADAGKAPCCCNAAAWLATVSAICRTSPPSSPISAAIGSTAPRALFTLLSTRFSTPLSRREISATWRARSAVPRERSAIWSPRSPRSRRRLPMLL